jgi:hypothetical protein
MNTRNLKRVLLAGLALSIGLAIVATATTPVVEEGNPICGCGEYSFKIDSSPANMSYLTDTANITVSNNDDTYFDWSSKWPVCAVIVKGGNNANVYYYGEAYGDTGLHPPINPNNGKPYGISHVTFCYDKPKTATIRGIKWHDRNCDGLKNDITEELLQGWEITLFKFDGVDDEGEPVWVECPPPVLTDEDGAYSFTVKQAGLYRVCETGQDGWKQTFPASQCHELNVVLGNDYADNDFGNVELGSISGFKFKDCDADGFWGAGEPGIKGWIIVLVGTDLCDNEVGPEIAKTNVDGRYTFDGLMPGCYTICEETRANWKPTTPMCFVVELSAGEDYVASPETLDVFGNAPLNSIKACKFYDSDRDGVRDEDEDAVEGVEFVLTDAAGNVLNSGWTDIDGCVVFDGLLPGEYKLREIVPVGWEATTPAEIPVTVACDVPSTYEYEFGNRKLPCWKGETAWADGLRYAQKGNWATYVSYSGIAKTATLLAGQTLDAGNVDFSAPDDEGKVTITITLKSGWRFALVNENVKIQDYNSAPSGNPSPGGFAHKDTATDSPFSIKVPGNAFYGVHANVDREVECP